MKNREILIIFFFFYSMLALYVFLRCAELDSDLSKLQIDVHELISDKGLN